MFVCVWCMCHCMYVEVWGHLVGVGFVLLPCGFWALILDHHTYSQAPLLAKSSSLFLKGFPIFPKFFSNFFLCLYYPEWQNHAWWIIVAKVLHNTCILFPFPFSFLLINFLIVVVDFHFIFFSFFPLFSLFSCNAFQLQHPLLDYIPTIVSPPSSPQVLPHTSPLPQIPCFSISLQEKKIRSPTISIEHR